jgi:hypothetical protein
MKVEAPRIPDSGGSGGLIIGGTIGGGFGGSGGRATAESVNAKGEKSAKDAKDKKEKDGKAKETSVFDTLLGLVTPEIRKIIDRLTKIGISYSETETTKTLRRDPESGEIIEETQKTKCKSFGVNDQKPSCTQIKLNQWVDPQDGQQKMIVTVSEVETVENPRPSLTVPRYGWKVIDSFQFVATSQEEFENKILAISEL